MKQERESLGYNKSKMAAMLGISSQLYGQYEDKGSMPGIDLAIKWREVFGSDLLGPFERKLSDPLTIIAEANRELAKNNTKLVDTNSQLTTEVLAVLQRLSSTAPRQALPEDVQAGRLPGQPVERLGLRSKYSKGNDAKDKASKSV